VDPDYLHDSLILSLAQAEGVLVANDPQGLRDLNEKLAALLFPHAARRPWSAATPPPCAPFVVEHRECVLKPLDGMGGRSIFRVNAGESNVNVILETLTAGGRHLAMAQRYLPEIRDGRQAHPAGGRRAGALLPGPDPAGRGVPRQPRRPAAAARVAR
jgi:glutathione synthase